MKSTPAELINRLIYRLRLIEIISYPGACDLMVRPRKFSAIFSQRNFITIVLVSHAAR